MAHFKTHFMCTCIIHPVFWQTVQCQWFTNAIQIDVQLQKKSVKFIRAIMIHNFLENICGLICKKQGPFSLLIIITHFSVTTLLSGHSDTMLLMTGF